MLQRKEFFAANFFEKLSFLNLTIGLHHGVAYTAFQNFCFEKYTVIYNCACQLLVPESDGTSHFKKKHLISRT